MCDCITLICALSSQCARIKLRDTLEQRSPVAAAGPARARAILFAPLAARGVRRLSAGALYFDPHLLRSGRHAGLHQPLHQLVRSSLLYCYVAAFG